MELGALARAAASGAPGPLLTAGLSLLIIGIGFKLALVPFHMWTPDVYQGAPVPATAFVASVSKGAVFALLLRYFSAIGVDRFFPLMLIFSLIAIASMLAGNLLALRQNNLKRLLAYSSIAHLGYALVGLLAGGPLAAVAVTYYLVAYMVTILGAFGVVAVLSSEGRDAEEIEDTRGLYWRSPWLAALLTAMLFSLAGIPLTAGFVGKFYVLAAGVRSERWILVLTLVLGSAIGIYYYLRVVVAIYATPTDFTSPRASTSPRAAPALALGGGLALAALVLLLVWLGVYPAPLIHLIRQTIGPM
jgi:NADH-quinone oxidoreductase subunit N